MESIIPAITPANKYIGTPFHYISFLSYGPWNMIIY